MGQSKTSGLHILKHLQKIKIDILVIHKLMDENSFEGYSSEPNQL